MKRDILSLAISIFFFFSRISAVQAATYFVATNGNDNNGGISTSTPLRTIQKAVNLVSAGDTISVLSGTYNENVVIGKSGGKENPITLTHYGNDAVTINGGTGTPIRDNIASDFWIIDGLTLTTSGSSSYGMLISSSAWGGTIVHDWIVRNCKLMGGGILVRGYNNLIENNNIDGQHVSKSGDDYSSGIRETYGGDVRQSAVINSGYTHNNIYKGNTIKGFSRSGIWSMGFTHDDVFENNTIFDIYGSGNSGQCLDLDGAGTIEYRHIIRGNNISGCGSEAIQLENVFDSLLENNYIHDTPVRGITLINYGANIGCLTGGENNQYGDTNGDNSCAEADSKNIIRQNVIVNSSGGAFVNYSMDGVHYFNNSLYGGSAGMAFYATQYLKSTEVIGNIINGSLPAGFKTNLNNITNTANIYNNPPTDLTLKNGSIAIDKIFNINSYSNSVSYNLITDFANHPRLVGSAYDIGAYEFGSNTTNTPTLTPSLTLSPTSSPKIGDSNGDKLINGLDYSIWSTGYKPAIIQNGGITIADFNKDNYVDGIDYIIWVNHYGK